MLLKLSKSLVFAGCMLFLIAPLAVAAPTVSLSTNGIASTEKTNVLLQLSNMSAGATAFVQQYVDVNQNGSVDSADVVIRSFHVTDGQESIINPNIQGDEDGAVNGQILTTLNYHALAEYHCAGNYLFQATVSSESGETTFTINQTETNQSVSGNITTNGQFPGAWVVLMDPVLDTVRASVYANSDGSYQIYAPEEGNYIVGAITYRSGFYADFSTFQAADLTGGGHVSIPDVALGSGGYTVSGKIVDEANVSQGVNGLQVEFESDDIMAFALTDEAGNFTVTVPAGTYEGQVLGGHALSGAVHKGYIAYDDGEVLDVNANITGIVGEVKPIEVYVSGRVTGYNNSPVSGMTVFAGNWGDEGSGNDIFEASATTDEQGYYTLGLTESENWYVEVNWNEDNEVNFQYVGGQQRVDTTAGNVSNVDFYVRPATAWIEGSVNYNSGDPVEGEWLNSSLPNWSFNHGGEAIDGFYRMPVFAGEWRVEPWPDGCLNAAFVEDGQTVTIDVNYDGNSFGACNLDIDGDGRENYSDNCPATSNAGQDDANSDGIGNACDLNDFDRDQLSDRQEFFLGTDPENPDTDGDGFIDGEDPNPTTVDTVRASIEYFAVLNTTRADGSQYAQISLEIPGLADSLGPLSVELAGPGNFRYSFNDSDVYSREVYKSFSSLDEGVYTVTVTDGSGGQAVRSDRFAGAQATPLVDTSKLVYTLQDDGNYVFRWPQIEDDYSYYYRFRIKDAQTGELVYSSSRTHSSMAWVHSSDLPNSAENAYTYQIETCDRDSYELIFNRSRTDDIPFTANSGNVAVLLRPQVYHRTEAGGTHYVVLSVELPGEFSLDDIDSALMSGPDGYQYTFDKSIDYESFDNSLWHKVISTDPLFPTQTGLYTVNLMMADGSQHSGSSVLTDYIEYPTPDNNSWQVHNLGDGDLRFSWADVNYNGLLYYRIIILDGNDGYFLTSRQHKKDVIVSQDDIKTALNVDSSVNLNDLNLSWRVEAHDSSSGNTLRNRSNGDAIPLVIPNYDPSVISLFSRISNRNNSYGSAFVRLWADLPTSDTSQIQTFNVTGPDAYSVDLVSEGDLYLGPDYQGYQYTERNSAPSGLYEISLSATEGSSTSYDT